MERNLNTAPYVGDGERIAYEEAKRWREAQKTGDFSDFMTDGQNGIWLAHIAIRELGTPDLTVQQVLDYHQLGIHLQHLLDDENKGFIS